MKNFQKISKALVFALVVLISGLFLGSSTRATPGKINVCHMPPGNVSNCQEISVSTNALEAHLAHGDNLVCHEAEELPVYQHILREFLEAQPYSLIAIMTDF